MNMKFLCPNTTAPLVCGEGSEAGSAPSDICMWELNVRVNWGGGNPGSYIYTYVRLLATIAFLRVKMKLVLSRHGGI
jgi:hypothetical protein